MPLDSDTLLVFALAIHTNSEVRSYFQQFWESFQTHPKQCPRRKIIDEFVSKYNIPITKIGRAHV